MRNNRRADGRYELRSGNAVLIEAPDAGAVKRIEYYTVDRSGLERFRGYLNDGSCPDRIAMLRLWMTQVQPVQVPARLSWPVCVDLMQRIATLKSLGILGAQRLRMHAYLPDPFGSVPHSGCTCCSGLTSRLR